MPAAKPVKAKARYLGPVLLSGPGDDKSLKDAAERLRSSSQVAKAAVHIAEEQIKITDRAEKDVLLLAERSTICCHGSPDGLTTFLCLVVDQNKRFYCHVLNMPKSEAIKARDAITAAFGGGNCQVVPAWKHKNKRRYRQSMKVQRKPSIASAPSNGFDPHAKQTVPPPR